jgi:DNA-binding NtrC family response regulator
MNMIDAAANLSPAVDTSEDRQANSADSGAGTRGTPGILVVEDEEGIRAVLDIALRQQGFMVWLARNGLEGIDLYRRHRETIGMVLLDVHMPGLDGPHTLAALQELEPQIPCCFMSGDLGHYTHRQLCSLGAATVIRKPFPLMAVAQMLWNLASQAASQSGRNRNEHQPSSA